MNKNDFFINNIIINKMISINDIKSDLFDSKKDILSHYNIFGQNLLKYCVSSGSCAALYIIHKIDNFIFNNIDFFLIDPKNMEPLCKYLFAEAKEDKAKLSSDDCILTIIHESFTYRILNVTKLALWCDKNDHIGKLLTLFDTDYTKCAIYNDEIWVMPDFINAIKTKTCKYIQNLERRSLAIKRGFKILDKTCDDNDVLSMPLSKSINLEQGIIKFAESSGSNIMNVMLSCTGEMYCEECEGIDELIALDKHYCKVCITNDYKCDIVKTITDHDAIVLRIGEYKFSFKNEKNARDFYRDFSDKNSIYEIIHRLTDFHPCYQEKFTLPDKKTDELFETFNKHFCNKGIDHSEEYTKTVLYYLFEMLITSHIVKNVDELKKNNLSEFIPILDSERLVNGHFIIDPTGEAPYLISHSKDELIDFLIARGIDTNDLIKMAKATK